MIPFFRKIRKKLADDNKPLKYLRYAIGEIVLVVIGILIALSINNWNQEIKSLEKTNLLLTQVHKELAFNLKKANGVIERYRRNDSLIYYVLNRKLTYNDYKSNRRYTNFMRGTTEANLVDDAFKTLIDNQNMFIQEQDSIVEKLRNLYGTDKREVDLLDEYTVNNGMNKIKKLETNGWLYDNHVNQTTSDEQITYYLTNPSYLGEVTEYKIRHLGDHNSYTLVFRNNAIKIYNELSDYLNIKKDTSIVKDLKEYQHYLGTYVSEDEVIYSEIIIKNENLVWSWKNINDTTKFGEIKIYPDTKTHFTFSNSRFGKLIYNENNEVNGFIRSLGHVRNEYKRIN
jgi:hypothetical protein